VSAASAHADTDTGGAGGLEQGAEHTFRPIWSGEVQQDYGQRSRDRNAPEPLAAFVAGHGYLPHGYVMALAGQIVCRRGLTIIDDGIELRSARERDRRGSSRLLAA
jgi:hypothetical protein